MRSVDLSSIVEDSPTLAEFNLRRQDTLARSVSNFDRLSAMLSLLYLEESDDIVMAVLKDLPNECPESRVAAPALIRLLGHSSPQIQWEAANQMLQIPREEVDLLYPLAFATEDLFEGDLRKDMRAEIRELDYPLLARIEKLREMQRRASDSAKLINLAPNKFVGDRRQMEVAMVSVFTPCHEAQVESLRLLRRMYRAGDDLAKGSLRAFSEYALVREPLASHSVKALLMDVVSLAVREEPFDTVTLLRELDNPDPWVAAHAALSVVINLPVYQDIALDTLLRAFDRPVIFSERSSPSGRSVADTARGAIDAMEKEYYFYKYAVPIYLEKEFGAELDLSGPLKSIEEYLGEVEAIVDRYKVEEAEVRAGLRRRLNLLSQRYLIGLGQAGVRFLTPYAQEIYLKHSVEVVVDQSNPLSIRLQTLKVFSEVSIDCCEYLSDLLKIAIDPEEIPVLRAGVYRALTSFDGARYEDLEAVAEAARYFGISDRNPLVREAAEEAWWDQRGKMVVKSVFED